jgi:hypothetical protein
MNGSSGASAKQRFVVRDSIMRSFRARIERGRIIVHEPLDLPDGVVYLVVKEETNGDTEAPRPLESKLSSRSPSPPPAESDHRSSS